MDAGLLAPAGFGDHVWRDAFWWKFLEPEVQGDGIQNDGPAGLEGVPVTVYHEGKAVGGTTSNAFGYYEVLGLRPGLSYRVQFGFPPAGSYFYWDFTPAGMTNQYQDSDPDADGYSAYFRPYSGEFVGHVDAGYRKVWITGPALMASYYPPDDVIATDALTGATVAGVVRLAPPDGASGSDGVAGATVELLDEAGRRVAETTTGDGGDYAFRNVPAGAYRVRFTAPEGYAFVPQVGGAADALGLTPLFILGLESTTHTADAPLVRLGIVSS